jgi:uncharacterized membrane protein YoaK (UPF0700 family)
MDNENIDKLGHHAENIDDEEMRFEQIMSMQSTLMTNNPAAIIATKYEASHLTQIISNKDKQSERDSKDARFNKIILFLIIFVIFAFVTTFCILFIDDKEMIKTVIVPLLTFIFGGSAGGIGGFGIGYTKGKNSGE